MKLKRLLLRYNPPGIGLECYDEDDSDDEPSVIHKDLPPTEDVKQAYQVWSLVEDLLAEEDMLNKKKHEKSLL